MSGIRPQEHGSSQQQQQQSPPPPLQGNVISVDTLKQWLLSLVVIFMIALVGLLMVKAFWRYANYRLANAFQKKKYASDDDEEEEEKPRRRSKKQEEWNGAEEDEEEQHPVRRRKPAKY